MPGLPKTLENDQISNPFVEKADINNHKKKIAEIDSKKEMIQTVYKNH